jgi:murein DD-endopeptidase MepM/ murein hydrolase activator NlpD
MTYANYTIRDLKNGKYEADTSYIYELPYEEGKRYLVVQGYYSNFSHKNEFSLDFKMKKGTKVCAARGGVVVGMYENSNIGGAKAKYMNDGNYVTIEHEDGTFAGYWHLDYQGALVERGDIVEKGQVIGLSGNTGYSAFPHLHFWVYDYRDGFTTLPTRFRTSKGVKYLKPSRKYLRPK